MNLSQEYNNRDRVPEHPAIIAGWERDAAAYRQHARVDIGLGYGARARNHLDVFHPSGEAKAPLIVFIHGGYWRSFDRSLFSHMAAGPNAHGFRVAVPSYTLCPHIDVASIIDEMRQACLFLWRQFGQRLIVAGHSAGGQLAACMAATSWEQLGAPDDLVLAGMGISGLYDLRPLAATPYNDDLRLDAAKALQVSPLCWPVKRRMAFDLPVGALESSEFIRQSRTLAAAWSGLGFKADCTEIAEENHFSIVNQLSLADSELTTRLLSVASS